jgi:hypothetical protein
MFGSVLGPRQQGHWGELVAQLWLTGQGYDVFAPVGHSRDVDLVAMRGSELLRVQVKTTAYFVCNRWSVTLATRGGNRSWSGMVKRFSPDRCDALFVLVADGRCWFIPAGVVGGGCGVNLGGPKYAQYEVDRGPPLPSSVDGESLSLTRLGGIPERSKGTDCKSVGSAFAGSNPAPATPLFALPT